MQIQTVNRKILTVLEASVALGLKPSTVRAWILRRQIAHFKVGLRAVRIPESEIQRILSEGLVPACQVRR